MTEMTKMTRIGSTKVVTNLAALRLLPTVLGREFHVTSWRLQHIDDAWTVSVSITIANDRYSVYAVDASGRCTFSARHRYRNDQDPQPGLPGRHDIEHVCWEWADGLYDT
jgi:hypothetical protein